MTFQVDIAKLDVTQDVRTYKCLHGYHSKIKDHFGINWPSVEWRDLRQPLYSGLAARLYMEAVKEAIPGEAIPEIFDGVAQAKYWNRHYNTSYERSQDMFTKDLENQEVLLTTQPNACGQGIVKATIDKINESGAFPDDKGFLRSIAHVESNDGMNADTYRDGFHGGIWQVITDTF